jgi:glycosyltransferase involved in cell wall biosynthesis
MIVKNAEMTIKTSLDALKEFDEVILYLNNTNDATSEIAQNYHNVKIIEGDFMGFGPTKNRAATYAKNDWILSLDSDEVLTSDFINNLKDTVLDPKSVYTILRSNYYKKTEIKHCWGNDIIVRLYNRSTTQFTDKKVHEQIIKDAMNVENITGKVKHFPYGNLTDFILKLDRYSTIYAEDNVGKKSSSPLKAISNAHFSFFKTYFLKRGFLDGYAGLVIAFSHMATNFYKYMKLYEANKVNDDKGKMCN